METPKPLKKLICTEQTEWRLNFRIKVVRYNASHTRRMMLSTTVQIPNTP